jgi:hypothetical protein
MNKLMELFNMDKVKQMIKDCPKDEIVILLPYYSINKPGYTETEFLNSHDQDDWDELEQEIGCSLQINDYDDLICDVHGIIE